jgi:hypothetical protein
MTAKTALAMLHDRDPRVAQVITTTTVDLSGDETVSLWAIGEDGGLVPGGHATARPTLQDAVHVVLARLRVAPAQHRANDVIPGE